MTRHPDDPPRLYIVANRGDMITRFEVLPPGRTDGTPWVPEEELAEALANVARLTKWRAEEKAKIKRQRKALTDLKAHCARIESERDGLARKVNAIQRSGDPLAHSELADLHARIHNQRREIARLRAKEAPAPPPPPGGDDEGEGVGC